MMRRRLFRDKRTAVSAATTAILLAALEVADGLASTDPEDEVDDQRTVELFGAAMSAAIVGSCISLTGRRPLPHRDSAWWSGLVLIWAGAAFNRVARRQLGSNYRSRVTVVPGHEVVKDGLYGRVRHPMYSGAALICTGAAIAVASPASALWVLPVLALVRRIEVEETMLRNVLGADYAHFARGRPRLVPKVW